MRRLSLLKHELQFVGNLLRAGAQFLVIGGYASKYYGCRESVKDLDLMIGTSRGNAKVIYPVVVSTLGYIPVFREEELTLPKKQLKFPDETIDIITSSDRVSFDSAWDKKMQSSEDSLIIPIMSLKDLIELKREASEDLQRRDKELADIECLERLKRTN